MTPRVDTEFKTLIPPLSTDERAQLEANIIADGCRDPLVVWEGVLLDGHNRLEICQSRDLPFQVVERTCKDRDEAKIWIIDNQDGRRNLSPFTRAELKHKKKDILAEQARVRQVAAGARGGEGGRGNKKTLPQISGAGITSRAQETDRRLAKEAGVSHDTFHKVSVIVAKAPEPVKEALRRGDTTINREYKAIVQAKRKAEQIAKVEAIPTLPNGPFHVIVADPPWAYAKRAGDPTHRADCPYPTMSTEDIAAMDIGSRAAEDSILWLWTTNAFMEQAHQIARAWGFEVKTILTWVKDRMGTGDWLRGQTEHCLMAVKGRPAVSLTNQTTFLNGKVREHSRKPEEFYQLVETLCHGHKCELFSRTPRTGWIAFGAETDQFTPEEAA